MDIQPNLRQIEAKKIYSHRIDAELVCNLRVFDARVNDLEILCEGRVTENKEECKNARNQKS